MKRVFQTLQKIWNLLLCMLFLLWLWIGLQLFCRVVLVFLSQLYYGGAKALLSLWREAIVVLSPCCSGRKGDPQH